MNDNIPNQVMQFQEITNKQWSMMKPHLPKPARTGRPRNNDRTTINVIMFVVITGCSLRMKKAPRLI